MEKQKKGVMEEPITPALTNANTTDQSTHEAAPESGQPASD